MASSHNYNFHNMSRIGEDNCAMSQRNLQNVHAGTYMTENFFSADCAMRNGLSLALSQPNINFTGSHQTGVGGCNIDDNSKLWNRNLDGILIKSPTILKNLENIDLILLASLHVVYFFFNFTLPNFLLLRIIFWFVFVSLCLFNPYTCN